MLKRINSRLSDALLLDLSHNKKLRRLSLPLVETKSDADQRHWFPFILSTIRSHVIEQITFTEIGYMDHPWATVDDLLSTDPHFANLLKLKCCFRFVPRSEPPGSAQNQQEMKFRRDPMQFLELPNSRRRGILEVVM